jgi:hypothetical protein
LEQKQIRKPQALESFSVLNHAMTSTKDDEFLRTVFQQLGIMSSSSGSLNYQCKHTVLHLHGRISVSYEEFSLLFSKKFLYM